VELPMPNQEARLTIFQVHTRGKPLAPDVDLAEMAECTEGLVGADIEGLCRQAAMLAIREFLEEQGGHGDTGTRGRGDDLLEIGRRHFDKALATRQREE